MSLCAVFAGFCPAYVFSAPHASLPTRLFSHRYYREVLETNHVVCSAIDINIEGLETNHVSRRFLSIARGQSAMQPGVGERL